MLERFEMRKYNSSAKTEVLTGITTFLAMISWVVGFTQLRRDPVIGEPGGSDHQPAQSCFPDEFPGYLVRDAFSPGCP